MNANEKMLFNAEWSLRSQYKGGMMDVNSLYPAMAEFEFPETDPAEADPEEARPARAPRLGDRVTVPALDSCPGKIVDVQISYTPDRFNVTIYGVSFDYMRGTRSAQAYYTADELALS